VVVDDRGVALWVVLLKLTDAPRPAAAMGHGQKRSQAMRTVDRFALPVGPFLELTKKDDNLTGAIFPSCPQLHLFN